MSLHELRRHGARFARETMCIGGGRGRAAIFERVDAYPAPQDAMPTVMLDERSARLALCSGQ
jgi:hypothetical protein